MRELRPETWPDFARIVEKHNGVWGGWWRVMLHRPTGKRTGSAAGNRALKEKLVRADRSHATLVYDGSHVVVWGLQHLKVVYRTDKG